MRLFITLEVIEENKGKSVIYVCIYIYGQHPSHAIRGQRGKEQFLDHVKAMKTPVLSYRLKGKVLS